MYKIFIDFCNVLKVRLTNVLLTKWSFLNFMGFWRLCFVIVAFTWHRLSYFTISSLRLYLHVYNRYSLSNFHFWITSFIIYLIEGFCFPPTFLSRLQRFPTLCFCGQSIRHSNNSWVCVLPSLQLVLMTDFSIVLQKDISPISVSITTTINSKVDSPLQLYNTASLRILLLLIFLKTCCLQLKLHLLKLGFLSLINLLGAANSNIFPMILKSDSRLLNPILFGKQWIRIKCLECITPLLTETPRYVGAAIIYIVTTIISFVTFGKDWYSVYIMFWHALVEYNMSGKPDNQTVLREDF